MGIFRRREDRTDGTIGADNQQDSLFSALLFDDVVTRDKAMQIPTIAGAIDLIAGVIASTPVKLYREDDGKATEVVGDRRVFLLNDETGDTLTANEFWRAMVADYYLGKGAYAYIGRSLAGEILGIYYVDNRNVCIQPGVDPIFKDYNVLVQGKAYRPYEFLRILRNTRDGAQGVPITVTHSKLISVAYTTLLFETNMARRGGNKKGFLKSDKPVTGDNYTKLRTAFARLYNKDADNFVLLNNDISFQETSNTAAEMQLNENKKVNADEFAKLFHISADVLAGKASEQDAAGLAKLAAIPLMTTIQCALNRDLLYEREKGHLYWAFDTKEMLKSAIKERYEAYKLATQNGWMTKNEVRYAEDMKAIDGLDIITSSLGEVVFEANTGRYYVPNTDTIMGADLSTGERGGTGNESCPTDA